MFFCINKKHQIRFCLPFCYLLVYESEQCVLSLSLCCNTRSYRLLSLTFDTLTASSYFFLSYPFTVQVPSDGQAGQQSGPSRVAAVGPYIQSSTMPRGPMRHDLLVKPAYPDGTATLPAHDPQSKAGTGEQPETTHCRQPFTS